jgi:hypothetical protein
MTVTSTWAPPAGPRLRIGSLCTGYGGLDLAVLDVLGGQMIWCAAPDPTSDDCWPCAGRTYPTSATSPASTGPRWLLST